MKNLIFLVMFSLSILPAVCFAREKLQIEDTQFDLKNASGGDTFSGYVVYEDNDGEVPVDKVSIRFTEYYNFNNTIFETVSSKEGVFGFDDFNNSMSFNILCSKEGYYTALMQRQSSGYDGIPTQLIAKIYLQTDNGSINATGMWSGLLKATEVYGMFVNINMKQSGSKITGKIKGQKRDKIKGFIKGTIDKNVITGTMNVSIKGCKYILKYFAIINETEKDSMSMSFKGRDCDGGLADNYGFRENLLYLER